MNVSYENLIVDVSLDNEVPFWQ